VAELTSTPVVHPIVALDVPDAASARVLVERLGDACDFYKVGLELFTAEGPSVVRWLRDEGKLVFLDLKLHDIPNTVRSAARNAARLGASLLTVHASGGDAMLRAAVEGAREGSIEGDAPCGILGVTILTSHDGASIGAAWGRDPVDVEREVLRLAADVRGAGGAGVVCSGHEAAAVHAAHGSDLGLLIPGIRLAGGPAHDQKRVMTPAAAADAGARWIILGRAVTESADPAAAMAAVRDALGGRG
jgi:orotidine-5'-phosphate decarboxylase